MDGASVLRESGAPPFVRGAKASVRYHLDHGPGARVQVLDVPACRDAGVCDEHGALLPALLGQAEAQSFELAQTRVPGEVEVALPTLGPAPIRAEVREVEGRGGSLVLSLSHEDSSDPLLLWRAAAALQAQRARWFRAGEWLYVQFEAEGQGVGCAVARVDLRRAAADVFNARGVAHLREGALPGARADLEQAVELAPEDPRAAYNLACALALFGDAGKALEWLERALWLDDSGGLRLWARRDPDLASLRDTEGFDLLTGGSK